MFDKIRYWYLQVLGYATFRRRVYVHGRFRVGRPANVVIGEGCSINQDVYILARHRIRIGDRVTLSARCMLLDSGLDLAGGHNHVDGDIVIEDDVWVGAGAIVLPNVVLGRGCVVGAGSVVTRSVPPGCVYAGNPARFLKMISS
ncbi:acyltransferase [Arenimonas caeni]|uniref:Acyltransferase n=1 Tax=Arenimonas caeni TaxID=2058085 RepID=A0A2P6MBP3_9GAMM|nr:hypothetical protein C6N40_01795 [Arenimonas caeni]